MNTERIEKIAALIESDPSGFDMDHTCRCIAARSFEVATGQRPDWQWSGRTFPTAKKYLWLSEKDAKKLFQPEWLEDFERNQKNRFDASLAVRTLRRAARLGKIIWR